MLYTICDGHAGVSAAKYVSRNLNRVLCSKLLLRLPEFQFNNPSEGWGDEVAQRVRGGSERWSGEWSKLPGLRLSGPFDVPFTAIL